MKRQTGYSLLEIMLVVGVVAVATVGILHSYNKTNAAAQAVSYADATNLLIENLELGVGQMQSYYGLTNAIAVERHLVPAQFERGGDIGTSWGAVAIGPAGSLNNGIRLTFEGVKPASCVDFISRVSGQMQQVKVNGLVVAQDRKADISALSRDCQIGGTIVMDRFENAFGRKAMWETWGASAPPVSAPPVSGGGPVLPGPVKVPAPPPTDYPGPQLPPTF